MTNKLPDNELYELVSGILEEAAFIFTDPAQEIESRSEDAISVLLPFTGDSAGSLVLTTGANICTEIAANLLGIEPDDPLALTKATEAQGEILNIIAGKLLVELLGNHTNYTIGIPEAISPTISEYQQMQERAVQSLYLIDEEMRKVDLLIIIEADA